jgi:hypothetical protein
VGSIRQNDWSVTGVPSLKVRASAITRQQADGTNVKSGDMGTIKSFVCDLPV